MSGPGVVPGSVPGGPTVEIPRPYMPRTLGMASDSMGPMGDVPRPDRGRRVVDENGEDSDGTTDSDDDEERELIELAGLSFTAGIYEHAFATSTLVPIRRRFRLLVKVVSFGINLEINKKIQYVT